MGLVIIENIGHIINGIVRAFRHNTNQGYLKLAHDSTPWWNVRIEFNYVNKGSPVCQNKYSHKWSNYNSCHCLESRHVYCKSATISTTNLLLKVCWISPTSWCNERTLVNTLTPGRCRCNFKLVLSKVISMIDIWSISCKITLMWIPQDPADD